MGKNTNKGKGKQVEEEEYDEHSIQAKAMPKYTKKKREGERSKGKVYKNLVLGGMDMGAGGSRKSVDKTGDLERQKALLVRLESMQFRGTTYPHEVTMRELGIFNDVQKMFTEMDLSVFMTKYYAAYQSQTCQFLSTLKVIFYEEDQEAPEADGGGFITFKVGRSSHRLSLAELEDIFGFEREPSRIRKPYNTTTSCNALWEAMSGRPYKSSESKGAHIRNPAVRYAHKAVAHTFFCRTDTGCCTKKELEFLHLGLDKVFTHDMRGRELTPGDREVGTITKLLLRFLDIQEWALGLSPEQAREKFLEVGGHITAILRPCGIHMIGEPHKPQFIDIPYLINSWYLGGGVRNGLVYKFNHPSKPGRSSMTLPCPALTNVNTCENIIFNHPPSTLLQRAGSQRGQSTREAAEAFSSNSPPPQPEEQRVYGSARYDFTNHSSPRMSEDLAKAHKHIGLLQRYIKWQGKTIKKLVKSVKQLNRAKRSDLDEARMEMEDANRRHIPSTSAQPGEEEGSTGQPRERRGSRSKQRKRKAMKLPSPESSNPSLSMEETSSSSSTH